MDICDEFNRGLRQGTVHLYDGKNYTIKADDSREMVCSDQFSILTDKETGEKYTIKSYEIINDIRSAYESNFDTLTQRRPSRRFLFNAGLVSENVILLFSHMTGLSKSSNAIGPG